MNEVKQLLVAMLSFNHKLQSFMDGELKVLLQKSNFAIFYSTLWFELYPVFV